MRRNKLVISRPLFLLLAIAITWLGFGIRLHNLGGDSLWIDEQLTLQTARLGFPEVLTAARDHPPILYILTSLTIRQFGETEFAARLASLYAGTLAIPLMILFGSVLRRRSAGLWAALFLAFSPFHLRYAQESRHYALLMSLSLVTYILLYLALTRPRARYWIGFGIVTALNLYIHYGAFMVLGSQIVLIGLWVVWQHHKRNFKIILLPFLAALITFLLYLPWLPYFLASLDYNVGVTTVSDTGGIAPIGQWAREAFYSFGMYYNPLPYGVLLLVFVGLLILFMQRDVLTIGFLLSGMVLPFILIQAGYVARGASARYIIYILPLYLFTAAVTPATITAVLNLRYDRKAVASFVTLSALFLLFLAWRPVQREYAFVWDDWRGVVQYLDQNAGNGDIIAAFSMNSRNGFNNAASSLPYYLKRQATNSYTLLHGNKVTRQSLDDLQDSNGQVWIVLTDYQFNKEVFQELGFIPRRIQSQIYVMPNPDDHGPILDQVITLFEQLVPLADKPSPSCFLEKDLALLYARSGDFSTAERRLTNALADCPTHLTGPNIWYDLQSDIPRVIFEGAILSYLQDNNIEDAKRVAGNLYQLDPRNKIALDALTVVNLLDVYESGEVQIDDADSLEPVSVSEFVMPQTGDAGTALLIHPPSSVSFPLILPEEPLKFSARVAMAPQSWGWGGDGSTFYVTLNTENGDTIELSNLHVSNDQEDRRWHVIDISLVQFAGQTVTLTLTTGPGTAGDFSGDWAGWETPRIMRISP